LGLTGLTVLPIPNIDDIALVFQHSQELRALQDQGAPIQDALIYYNATTAHLDALRSVSGQYPGRITFFGDEVGLVFFRMPGPVHETAHLELFLEIQNIIVRMGLNATAELLAQQSSKLPARKISKETAVSGLIHLAQLVTSFPL
jgi:hypothetical protein